MIYSYFFNSILKTIVCICSFLLIMIFWLVYRTAPKTAHFIKKNGHLDHSYHSRANTCISLVVLKNYSRWQNQLHETLHMWLINDHGRFVIPNVVRTNVLLPNLKNFQETRLFHSWEWNPEILLHWTYDINEPLWINE